MKVAKGEYNLVAETVLREHEESRDRERKRQQLEDIGRREMGKEAHITILRVTRALDIVSLRFIFFCVLLNEIFFQTSTSSPSLYTRSRMKVAKEE